MIRLTWNGNVLAQMEANQAFRKLRPKRLKRKRKNKRNHRPPSTAGYSSYINSKEWRRKREEALKHYGRKCCECGSVHNLTVHHKTYVRLGNEKMKDLVVLCWPCHGLKHENKYTPQDHLSVEFRNIVES